MSISLALLNPGKRRGRRRNGSVYRNMKTGRFRHGKGKLVGSVNPRRHRRHASRLFALNTSASHSTGYIPAFGNPGLVQGAKAAFSPHILKNVGEIALGAFANKFLSEKVSEYLPAGWQSGWKAAIVAAGTSGLLGGAGALVNPRFGARLAAGGLMQAVTSAIIPFVTPAPVKPVPPPAVLQGLYGKHHGDIIGAIAQFGSDD